MTLVSRNRLILSLFIVAVVFIIATAVVFILATTGNSVALPQTAQRLFALPQNFLFGENWLAAIAAALVLTLYAAVTLGISLVNFEKTPSKEVVFFSFFALGCLFEGIRIWLPTFNFWENYSVLYVAVGRTLFFGRVLSVISLLALALLSVELENKQDIELFLLIAAAISVLLARFMPVNSLVVPSNLGIRFGYEKLFLAVSVITLLAGILSMTHQAREQGSEEYIHVSQGFILLSLGYLVLTETDCLVFLIAGFLLLAGGTTRFFLKLHKFHMWK